MPSENQTLVDFYIEIVAALLKCYMLLQMTYMVQMVNDLGKNKRFRLEFQFNLCIHWSLSLTFFGLCSGNFNDPADKLRESFTHNVATLQNYVIFELQNASRAIWACDPDDFYDPGVLKYFFLCVCVPIYLCFDRFVHRNIEILPRVCRQREKFESRIYMPKHL